MKGTKEKGKRIDWLNLFYLCCIYAILISNERRKNMKSITKRWQLKKHKSNKTKNRS